MSAGIEAWASIQFEQQKRVITDKKSSITTSRIAFLVALLLFVAAPDSVESPQEPVASEALPEAAFSMDLSLFSAGASITGSRGTNFLSAAIRVLIVNTGIYSALYIPAQVTAAA